MTSTSAPTFSPPAVADLRNRFDAALAALKAGRNEEALQFAEPLLTTAAASPDLQHLLALITAALEDDAASEHYFREALRLDPSYVVSIEQFSRFLIARGRAEDAVALTGAGPARLNPVVLNQHASGLNALDRRDEAIEALHQATRIVPTSVIAAHNHAMHLGEVERHVEAEAEARRALRLGVVLPETQYVLARALMGQDRHEEAEAAFVAALALKPDYTEAHTQLAELIWMRTADLAEADARLAAAEASASAPAALSVARAQLLRFAGDERGAYELLKSALERQTPTAALLVAVSKAAMKCGEPEQALQYAAEANNREPGDLDSRFALCEMFLGYGDPQSAARIGEALVGDLPNDQNAVSLLATAWRMLGDERYAALYDYETFVCSDLIDTPKGWSNLGAYLADLEEGLGGLHTMKAHPVGQSLRGGTQTIPTLLNAAHPAVKAFPTAIDGPIRRYLDHLGYGEDVLRRRNGHGYRIKGIWSVRLQPNGFHTDHVHPQGWISSACYIALPSVVSGGGKEGWIKFGEPGPATRPALAAEHFVKPEPGLLVLFPSYMWHGTVPFTGDQTRLTSAFDLVPHNRPGR